VEPVESHSAAAGQDTTLGDDWQRLEPPPEFLRQQVRPIETEAVPACPVCGGEYFHTLCVGFDYELRTCSNPWQMVRCGACGHVWLNPRPAVGALSTIYPPHYYAYNFEQDIHPIAVWGKRRLDRAKLRGICRATNMPDTFLDVGCGQGRYLDAMAEMGLPRERIIGLELDERIVAELRERGFQAFAGRVETCDEIAPESIQLATMFHVIEHVDDPGEVVEKIIGWLKPGGVFAVETPNIDSLDARLFADGYWGGYHFPRHWNLFTPESLARLLSDRGLEVLTTRYQTGHSFWMYSLHHRLRYAARPKVRLSRWFDPFKSLLPLVTFTAWDTLRAKLGAHTSAMLMLARKP